MNYYMFKVSREFRKPFICDWHPGWGGSIPILHQSFQTFWVNIHQIWSVFFHHFSTPHLAARHQTHRPGVTSRCIHDHPTKTQAVKGWKVVLKEIAIGPMVMGNSMPKDTFDGTSIQIPSLKLTVCLWKLAIPKKETIVIQRSILGLH